MELIKMQMSWSRQALIEDDRCPPKRTDAETQRHAGRSHVATEAAAGVAVYQPRDTWTPNS